MIDKARANLSILMTVDTIGGVWPYALDLARGLASKGVHITLASMGEPIRQSQRAELNELSNVSLEESTYALEWMDNPWEDVERARTWLVELERRVRPDVVHINGYAHAASPFSAPSIVVSHSCVLSWWKAVLEEDAPARYEPYREAVKRGLGAAAAVVAPTRAMMSALETHYGSVKNGKVIANGRSRPNMQLNAEREPFVLTAGRVWDRAKNVASVACASKSVKWPIFIAGQEAFLNGAKVDLGASKRLGWLPAAELHGWMARASIFTMPARYEPFGLSALEAARAGCALVLGDIESLREVWGDAAVYVPPNDPSAIGNAINELAEKPEERAAMAARAHARAARYTIEQMAGEYFGLYTSLMSSRQPTQVATCA